ncbi:ribonuclease-domain-containing protein [Bimuria novae-zelandiae CBS 107.79]|uniref:ribonuclease T1 n=1 Tax=Bimuria novae-zelandiae CBS 107.79 TaxID=1447943 RepID=A0A6A5V6Q9_9PLEO|nr:ribonuclease-domain-containing protein [Bimuria novae-zelandiae CBS 107.79]
MKFLSGLLFAVSVAFALPTSVVEAPVESAEIEERACYVTCGSNCYTSAQVTAARNTGYNYVKQGGTASGGSYPHVYNNYEGFDFLVSGTYYEFPLKTSGTYVGGSPGADRVIFNQAGQRAGEITHTGASGNNFVACQGW